MALRRTIGKLLEAVGLALNELWLSHFTRLGWVLWDSPDPPQPPDYAGAAKAEGASGTQTAILNALIGRVRQSTPFGSQTWSPEGVIDVPSIGGLPGFQIPNYSSAINLTPRGQQLLDAQTGQQLGLAELASQVQPSVAASLQKPLDFGGIRQPYDPYLADTVFRRQTRYLDPQYESAERSLRDRLVNQGFSTGTEGMTRALDEFAQGKERAYGQAADVATERGRQVGMDERRQAISELLLQRQQPLSEFNALRTGAQPQLPSFQQFPSGTATPTQYLNAAQQSGQAANDIFNSQVGSYNNMLQGVFGLGGAAIPWLLL